MAKMKGLDHVMLTAVALLSSISVMGALEFSPARIQETVEAAPALEDNLHEVPGSRIYSGALIVRLVSDNPTRAEEMGVRATHEHREAGIAALTRFRINRFIEETGEYLIAVPKDESDAAVAKELRATGNFDYVEPDWLLSPVGCPNDPAFAQQWHHGIVGSCAAWNHSTGSPVVTVAICDSGVRPTHSDLRLNRREGYNSVSRTWESAGGEVSDVYGHGTMVAGCAAATGNNGIGGSGMAWNIAYRPLRITNDPELGLAYLSDIVEAVRVAADAGDKVINVSYSGVNSASAATNAAYARSRGSLVVWSAGNEGAYLGGARDDSMLVVGATQSADGITAWSNYGSFVDLVAPGEAIRTCSNASDSAMTNASGTSFAAPLTAGLCALVWSRNPSLSPAQVEAYVKSACTDRGAVGVDDVYGHGRIDAAATMTSVSAARRHTLWATSVPDNTAWTNESYAAGAPTCSDCNSSACQYSTNGINGSTAALVGLDFEDFVLPAGHRIVKVEVEVSGRYNTNTIANLGFRAVAPSHAIDSGWRNSPNFTSGTLCADRLGATGDITTIHSAWTASKINNLQFQVRRKAGLTNNTLRIVSLKVVVTTAPL
jgi:subtilisin family serine protease